MRDGLRPGRGRLHARCGRTRGRRTAPRSRSSRAATRTARSASFRARAGRERNRRLRDVVDECRRLLGEGAVEIELLGQTVNAYRDPATGEDFADLLARGRCAAGTSAPALRDVPPAEFLRRSLIRGDGRHSRGRPRPPPAGPVRLRRGAPPHEAPVHARGVPRPRRVASRRHPGPCALHRRHRRLSGRDATTTSRRRSLSLEEVRFAGVFSFTYSPRPRTAAARWEHDVTPAKGIRPACAAHVHSAGDPAAVESRMEGRDARRARRGSRQKGARSARAAPAATAS